MVETVAVLRALRTSSSSASFTTGDATRSCTAQSSDGASRRSWRLPSGISKRHHDTLTKRVDRWVGHLREALLEVVVDGVRLVGEDGKWRVLTEREEGLLPSVRHVAELHLDVL